LSESDVKNMKKLYRPRTNRKLLGVCGGVAEYFNIDPTIVRLIWAIFAIFFCTGIIIYLLAAIIMPEY
jgi:phage shock protein C